jgi:uncharacterized protein
MTPRPLLDYLQSSFHLDWYCIHGIRHWARVRVNGLKLEKQTGTDPLVVEMFAYLHDSCRWNENRDSQHCSRAAVLARELQGRFYCHSLENLYRLAEACAGHTHETAHSDITIATCWDADRLDLGRVGIEPDPDRLCTEAARKLLSQRVE